MGEIEEFVVGGEAGSTRIAEFSEDELMFRLALAMAQAQGDTKVIETARAHPDVFMADAPPAMRRLLSFQARAAMAYFIERMKAAQEVQ